MRLKSNSGFTLIELMIVVAIIALLASIAFPSYQKSVRQAYRSDAYAGLGRMADLQERFYLQNRSYATQAQIAQVGGANTVEGYYTLSVDASDANGYTLKATANAGTAVAADTEGGTSCAILTFTSAQQMLPAVCWDR